MTSRPIDLEKLSVAKDIKEYRRVMRYMISPEIFPMTFMTGQKMEVVKGIPEGAIFRGYAHDFHTNSVFVFVEHESFPLTHMSQEVPLAEPMEMRRLE